ncbi:hypothetical protein SUGI_0795200 [Cryptomeria japonica]|nr:hypothetical protein SUGI_0795200 [Cryptomeria japonica]
MSVVSEGVVLAAGSNESLCGKVEGPGGPEVAILFVGVCLLLGVASRQLLRGTRIPYTGALLLLGIGLGALEYGTHSGLGKLGTSIRVWSKINPNLILYIFLPALLFESSFAMELHQIKRCMAQMVLLAFPGVLISTFFLGVPIHYLFPYDWDWKVSFLLGGLLSATDPVAVVSLLKELGASKKLNTIIEGESLMNDGTAIVVYRLFFQMVEGRTFNAAEVIEFLSRVALGAVALGLAFGIVSFCWLGVIFNDTVIEITLTLTVSYIAYFTAEDAAEVSGVLTVMTLGMFYAAVAKTAFKGESQQSLHHFWEMVAYIANTMIFILSGVVIAESILRSGNIKGGTWGDLVILYVLLQLSRVVVVVLLYPGLRYFGYGLDWKEAVILIWSGLRGAVALSLSLILNRSSGKGIAELSEATGNLFVYFTGGVVFLTLLINGSTTQYLLKFLGMNKTLDTKKRILDYTRYEMNNKALEAYGELGEDEELGPVDWPSVVKHISCLNALEEGEQPHPHDIPPNENEMHKMHMIDTRVRLLNGVQAAYWGMLDEGRITNTAAILLMQSVEEAIDMISTHEKLLDWKALKIYVQFPSYFKYLQMKFLPQKLVTFFTVQRLELACYIAAAFLRAHRIARRQLREFIGESEVAEIIIQESEAEGEPAKQFLEDVQLNFPEVLRVLKTKQVTYSVLLHLSEYVQNLEKSGLLDVKEMSQLHDAVQTDLKKLLRKPPSVQMPSVREILSSHPFLGALPSFISEPLGNAAKEFMKLRGNILYEEGSKPDGIWLIANGVVRWKSKSIAERHLLHPTFSHGSTLGLYEALTGKTHMCDLIADSVVHCFFIETEKILSALRLTPDIEDFFWQESAMVVAKLILPQQFEEMSMQELRVLVLERSTMRIYLRGEMFEIPPYDVAIVLEGFVKQEGKNEFATAPAVLLAAHKESHLTNAGSKQSITAHHGEWFDADTRSRIIIFGISSVHNVSHRTRSSASILSCSLRVPGRPSYEHEGLVSWPEKPYISGKSEQNAVTRYASDPGYRPSSEKSMQLSRFGSMVTGKKYSARGGRFLRVPWGTGLRSSKSYPSVKSKIRKFFSSTALLSVQSQGGPAMQRRLKSEGHIPTASAGPSKIPPRLGAATRKPADDSSEGSDAEDEYIVRIDSPSKLFHNQVSN